MLLKRTNTKIKTIFRKRAFAKALLPLALFLTLVFSFTTLKASENVILVTGEIQNLTPISQIFIDKESIHSFKTVKKLNLFKKFGKDSTGFKQSLKKTYWFKFSLRAKTKSPLFLTCLLYTSPSPRD